MSEADAGSAGAGAPPVVTARPIRSGRIANASALLVLVVFVIVAIVEPHANAGAHFGVEDQVFTGVLGLIIAAGLHLPARPRLHADATSVRFRGYAGNWREIPWESVSAIEFPGNVRFARLVFPGDEAYALYAVQRMDREIAVHTMRGLRALFAYTHQTA